MSCTSEINVRELSRAAKKLAIIGASVKLRSGIAADPAIRDLIDRGSELALGCGVVGMEDPEAAQLLVMAEMAFTEGSELLRNPGRAAGWNAEDPELLQSMGRASSGTFKRIVALAETRSLLSKSLQGRFLDVGTGVGGIALKAAETCPDLEVEGIDVWDFALTLARQNVAASPHGKRVNLSKLDVTDLYPGPRYTLVWLPTMFMTRSVVVRALDRINAASHSGAWLIAALYTTPDDPFAAVVSTLRTLRGGGELTDPAELAKMLCSSGYVDVEVDASPLATFVLGRLP